MKANPTYDLVKTTLSLLDRAVRAYSNREVEWVGVCLNCQKIIYDDHESAQCAKKRHTVLYLDLLYANTNEIYGALRCLRWLLKRMQKLAKGGAKR